MSNYIRVFSGNFIEVQRIFNELQNLNICAIIKDESESARLAGFGSPVQGLQEIHVHKDELKSAFKTVEKLTSKLQT
ncbi:MAG: DUF2007 domain-containing protein [Algibacter sp.]|uniref:DUF2007 domain-containing protein n=1 Tax=Algibacter sp. TaxID=1872428 RepID=UPI00262A3A52|nr:DUF2007 domain-containing protein [Algibacter sp.]MDG1730446.1 DUF2007 domain-containing protein [Algibacter sp.]MDG2177382.1 DUF2007 domain-containing protein [Algibacter sp.]